MGAHMLCIKDMAGLCKPHAAFKLVTALKEEIGIPVHFHTHDTSGINAASVLAASKAGVDIVDLAISSHVRLHLAAEPQFHRLRPRQHRARSRAGFRLAQRVLRLLGAGPRVLSTVQLRPALRHGGGLRTRDARRPIHQPPRAGERHGPRPPLARNRPHLCRGEPTLRRHRQGHPVVQSRRRHVHVPRHPRHQGGGRAEAQARLHRFPGKRHRHALRRPRPARWRLAGRGAEGRARQPARPPPCAPANSPIPSTSKPPAPSSPPSSAARPATTTSTRT